MLSKYYPNFYFNKVEDIPISLLIENNIKGVLLDMDNTLIDSFNNFNPTLKIWLKKLKEYGLKPIIISNCSSSKRVGKVAKRLNIDFIYNAKKPNLNGFEQALNILKIKKDNLIIIGDQIFTDILGAKKFGIKSILIKPISYFEAPVGLIKRPFEVPILISYKKKLKESR